MVAISPVIRWWGRLEVTGADLLRRDGPHLLIGNHDSNWDALVIGVAAGRRVHIRAMAKAELWHSPASGWLMNHMGQFKITRGRADRGELGAVLTSLRNGDCVGVFPEGRLSRGHKIRAYSGAGWLARSTPNVHIVAVAVTGVVDIVRFPKRPRVRVAFFEPVTEPGLCESSIGLSRRMLAEIRDRVPPVPAGR
jgi:1-acyl-sn-glycerol-3-phosphate acyltransferase